MTEQESWFDRNVFRFGKSPTPYERQPFQVEDGKPISGRIEIYTGHGLQRNHEMPGTRLSFPRTGHRWQVPHLQKGCHHRQNGKDVQITQKCN